MNSEGEKAMIGQGPVGLAQDCVKPGINFTSPTCSHCGGAAASRSFPFKPAEALFVSLTCRYFFSCHAPQQLPYKPLAPLLFPLAPLSQPLHLLTSLNLVFASTSPSWLIHLTQLPLSHLLHQLRNLYLPLPLPLLLPQACLQMWSSPFKAALLIKQ